MSTPTNGYITPTELLAFMPNSTNASASQIESAIEGASRAIEGATGKQFYPSIAANKYDLEAWYPRELNTFEDLLEVITLTNGDGAAIASTEYTLSPANRYPKDGVVINAYSQTRFQSSATTGSAQAITLLGLWGWARNYSAAWYNYATLTAAVSTTSATTLSISAYQEFEAGQIIRVDNELMRITAVNPTTQITVTRGWNGSTAATHLISQPVKIWQVEGDIKQACKILAAKLYLRRNAINGTTGGGDMGVQTSTAQGATRDPDVAEILAPYVDNF